MVLHIRQKLKGKKIDIGIINISKKEEYWCCEIKNNKARHIGNKPVIYRCKLIDRRLWKRVLGFTKSIYEHEEIVGEKIEDSGILIPKGVRFPLMILGMESIGVETGGRFGQPKEIISRVELEEKYSIPQRNLIPKAFIDGKGIVWKLNPNFIIKDDEKYKEEQVRWIIDECNYRIKKLENKIIRDQELLNNEEKKEIRDIEFINLLKTSLERDKKDIEFYKKRLLLLNNFEI